MAWAAIDRDVEDRVSRVFGMPDAPDDLIKECLSAVREGGAQARKSINYWSGLIVGLAAAFVLLANDSKAETTISFIKLGSSSPILYAIPPAMGYCMYRILISQAAANGYHRVHMALIRLKFPNLTEGMNYAMRSDATVDNYYDIILNFSTRRDRVSRAILEPLKTINFGVPAIVGGAFLIYAFVWLRDHGTNHVGYVVSFVVFFTLLIAANCVGFAVTLSNQTGIRARRQRSVNEIPPQPQPPQPETTPPVEGPPSAT